MSMTPPLLSICIPTYNRASTLRHCLDSVMDSISGHEDEIELIISNNDSSDSTEEVVQEYKKIYPWIRYNRNNVNLLCEGNIYFIASSMVRGRYVWFIGDDDFIERSAVSCALECIEEGYLVVLFNYSIWDRHLANKRVGKRFAFGRDIDFSDKDEFMRTFGVHIGYISTVVVKTSIFNKAPVEECRPLFKYCFPQAYSTYVGLIGQPFKGKFIDFPHIRNRSGNGWPVNFSLCYIEGIRVIFGSLVEQGYAPGAGRHVRTQVLREFVIPGLFFSKIGGEIKVSLSFLVTNLKDQWLFWLVCLPIYFIPGRLVRALRWGVRAVRQLRGR